MQKYKNYKKKKQLKKVKLHDKVENIEYEVFEKIYI